MVLVRIFSWLAILIACFSTLSASDVQALEIETFVEPLCEDGNSPGGCELIGSASGPSISGAFATPGDLNLDFRIVLAGNQIITLSSTLGFYISLEVTGLDTADLVTLSVNDLVLENRSGPVLATGALGSFDAEEEAGIPEDCELNRIQTQAPRIRFRCNSEEFFGEQDPITFQQVWVSFSLDRTPLTPPGVSIGELGVWDADNPEISVLVPEPQSLVLLVLGLGIFLRARCSQQ